MQNLTNLSPDTFWNGESVLSETNEEHFGAQCTQSNWRSTSAEKDGKLKCIKGNEHKYKREYEMKERQPVYQHEIQQEEEEEN
jgi:hypothetical protein